MLNVKTVVVAGLVVATGVWIVALYRDIAHLRVHNLALKNQSEAAQASNKFLAEQVKELDRLKQLDARDMELPRLRAEVKRLRDVESDLERLRDEAVRLREQLRAAKAPSADEERQRQRFEARRAVNINTMKRVGLQLHALAKEGKLGSAFTAEGVLNPALLGDVDLSGVELLVQDAAQLGQILQSSPRTIIARTVGPLPTPDGRWMRLYTQADHSVHTFTTDLPNQAFTGNWQLEILRSPSDEAR